MSSVRRRLPPLVTALVLLATAGCAGGRGGFEADLAMGAPPGGGLSAVLLRPPQTVDHEALARALDAAGVELVEGTSVYAARVARGAGGVRYDRFDAGGGALSTDFWPASSIKVVAAVGALEFLAGMGFTGEAVVTTEEWTATVWELYEEAVRDSSNLTYDWLVSIAGVDWLNNQFLVPANGFRATVIQRSYTDPWSGMVVSPAMTISEGDRTVELPAREPEGSVRCPDYGNCSNLLELTETVRRLVLADDIPAWERFAVSPEDTARLGSALLDADGFIELGVEAALGTDTAVFSKPGEAPDDDCLDVGVVDTDGADYVLGITTPVDGRACESVSELAAVTLSFLRTVQP